MSDLELLRLDLPSDPTAPRAARRRVSAVAEDLAEARRSDLELVVSELVTNAIEHGAAPVELVLRRSPRTITVEVCDGSSARPAIPSEASRRPHGGRGLFIVAQLSHDWGCRPHDAGKCVWAILGTGS